MFYVSIEMYGSVYGSRKSLRPPATAQTFLVNKKSSKTANGRIWGNGKDPSNGKDPDNGKDPGTEESGKGRDPVAAERSGGYANK